ncbi:MAG: hypothetical protein DRR08_19160 [Candidatus Parabeggiatoa sp. nov. 2]|nr:MAG: hypothetical protein B6247_22185 [Beggiatoa sp. 4572_84]RKZ57372.1 MAG: hypothetical protein DRR08_19160 [Gammaproteobacteria bacterium]HEC84123.1 right-handed parallel beta-helix repeat-containing protein [Thioploca sp.]
MRQQFFKLVLFGLLTTTSCLAADIWVDAGNGDDSRDGLSAASALRTLQAAANLATPGTVVHIQPGIYRESVKPANSGTPQAPIVYRAEMGAGTVTILGSETVANWIALTDNAIGLPAGVNPQNIVWADLSAWGLTTAPRFVVQLDAAGNVVSRLSLAREPDWQVQTAWKSHEFWWVADGGATVAECDPPSDKKPFSCDQDSRSLTQLIDQHDDTAPIGIELGNLATLDNLSGATLVAIDTVQGDYVFRRNITAHDVSAGQITVDRHVEHGSGSNNQGLGWGSKYYVENHPALLDNPGEYWFDLATGRLYLWPLSPDLQNVEISRRANGWDLTGLSYQTLNGLALEFFNDKAISLQNNSMQSSYGNQLHNLRVRYANQGLFAEQVLTAVSSADAVIQGLVLENSEIGYMDSEGIYLGSEWDNEADPALFIRAPITNTLIKNNHLHHFNFRSEKQESAGVEFRFADNLRFEENYVHHVAQHGVRLTESVIQSDKGFGFAPSEIKTGNILLKNNLIEHSCQLAGDCGGLTFWGTPPQRHVFRNVLVMGNTFRYNYGWSDVAKQRGRWKNGYFGFGVYLNDASGIHAYRNLAYNNGWAGFFLIQHWRDGEMILSNNLLANAGRGIDIWNPKNLDTQRSVDTKIVNNLFINHEDYGIGHTIAFDDAQSLINHNLYYANGWGSGYQAAAMKVVRGDAYERLADIKADTPWEANGVSEAPAFFSYDYEAQRQRGNNSVLDFELKRGSAAVERGTANRPSSLEALLAHFNIQEVPKQDSVWDIGPFEYSESDQPLLSLGSALEAATFQFQDTAAQFSGFVTTGFVTRTLGQRGNGLTFSQSDMIKVVAEVTPAASDVGQRAELVVVAAYTPPDSQDVLYFMLQGTQWAPWNLDLTTLAAAEIVSGLPKQFELFSEPPIEITVHEGYLTNLPGHFVIYVGYSLSNGIVVFNGQQPIQFTVQ